MKIVLINPALSVDSDKALGGEIHFFPEGLAVIASALLAVGHEVYIIDRCIQQHLPEDICEKADIFGVTGMINQFADLEKIIADLRELNPTAKVMLGGPLVTCAPRAIKQFLDFDFAILGEGEKSVVELLRNSRNPKPADGTALTVEGNFCMGSPRKYLCPEDFILPAFELFNLPWYLDGTIRAHHQQVVGMSRGVVNNFMVSRGCPRAENCAFCGQLFGHTKRCKPTLLIEKEMRAWIGAGALSIRFQDDNLAMLGEERLEQIFECTSNFGIAWAANSRVDTINEKKLSQMQRAGCKILYFGVESFSDEALSFSDKGTTVSRARRALKMTVDAGIRPGAFFLIGLPGENKRSLKKALRFVRENKVLVRPYILCPIPGTPLFELAQSQIINMRDYLRQCSNWENRQLNERKLYINLTDLPDELLLETYQELREIGEKGVN